MFSDQYISKKTFSIIFFKLGQKWPKNCINKFWIKFLVDGNFCLNYYMDMLNQIINQPLTQQKSIKNPDLSTGDHNRCSSRPSHLSREQAYNCTQFSARCNFSAKENTAWSLFSAIVAEAAASQEKYDSNQSIPR